MFKYRMRLRPMGIGCQPDGFIKYEDLDKKATGFWGEFTYSEKLTPEQIRKFELTEV